MSDENDEKEKEGEEIDEENEEHGEEDDIEHVEEPRGGRLSKKAPVNKKARKNSSNQRAAAEAWEWFNNGIPMSTLILLIAFFRI